MSPLKALCPTKRAGTCFNSALMVDKTLLNVEHILQSFEGTVSNIGVHCKALQTWANEGSLGPQPPWSSKNSAN